MPRYNAPRIGCISHSPWIAGAERALVHLLQHLPKGKARTAVVFPQIDGPLKSLVRDDFGLPVFELPYGIRIPTHGEAFTLESINREVAAFTEIYTQLELDGVVVNTTALYPASVAAALCDLPLVIHCHGVINEALLPGLDTAQWHKIDAAQVSLADKIIVPSAWIARCYRTFFGLSDRQLMVLPNGTNLPERDLLDRAGPASGPPQFSMLCTLEPNKGVETFVEAASMVLSQRRESAVFVVYGDGAPAYQRKLQDLISSLGLEDHFLLRPKQLDVSPIYAGSRAVIVTSHIESFSFVAIEAMSYSRPVIATRCGGPEEIITDGETGFLIEVGDSRALARRMLSLIEDVQLCERVGRAARAAAEARFDIRAIAKDYLSTILSVLQEPRT